LLSSLPAGAPVRVRVRVRVKVRVKVRVRVKARVCSARCLQALERWQGLQRPLAVTLTLALTPALAGRGGEP